jgi:beta-glucosidase
VLDNTDWTEKGETFMNCGSKEYRSTVNLNSSKFYEVPLEKAATPAPGEPHDNTLFASLCGIRIGMMPPTNEEAEVVVLVLGMNNDWEREGVDRSTLSLPCRTEDLIHAVCAANPNKVIVNQSACAVDMSWASKPAAVIQAWYQGQENGNAIADVLLGLANPSGKLPITFPRAIEDHGSAKWFPGDLDNDYVEYGEGVYMGYRLFDKQGTNPLWAFGYGLSYATFSLGSFQVHGHISRDNYPTVNFHIENTGNMAGGEVVQIYVSSSQLSEPVLVKSLKAFKKVYLEPGRKKMIYLEVGAEVFEWYDVDSKAWRLDVGLYQILVGYSSRDVRGTLDIIVM